MKIIKQKPRQVRCGNVLVEEMPELRPAGIANTETRRWELRLSVHERGVLNITDMPLFVVHTIGAEGEPYIADPPTHLLDASLQSLKRIETAGALVDQTMANLLEAIGKTLKIPLESVRLSQSFRADVQRIKMEVTSMQ